MRRAGSIGTPGAGSGRRWKYMPRDTNNQFLILISSFPFLPFGPCTANMAGELGALRCALS